MKVKALTRHQTTGPGVNHRPLTPYKTRQRQARRVRQIHRQCRRCRDGRQQLDSHLGNFVNHFVAGTTGHDHESVAPSLSRPDADQLVERHMPPDILAHGQDLPVRSTPCRGMRGAGFPRQHLQAGRPAIAASNAP